MPAASTATCGTSVSWLSSTDGSTERSTGALHVPPTGRVAAWTTLLATSRRRQTAVTLPAGSTASCGLGCSRPREVYRGCPGPAGGSRGGLDDELGAVVPGPDRGGVPSGSTPTAGVWAEPPAADRSRRGW